MIFQRIPTVASFAAISCVADAANAAGAMHPLASIAERSGYARTGRYAEVEQLCAAYQAKWPQTVRCFEFGRTPEGRPMLALVASRAQGLTPQDASAHSLPVLLIQGGIHAGEIDGKDAGFLALRELLEDQSANAALTKITLVFVPVFNVDGHERFGRWNRPNQVGPEEMGWRVTAQNLNLNRDYMKADAPEMARSSSTRSRTRSSLC
jgi:murein tripeptide amidase MpaA